MTEQAQRIAIAKWMGWEHLRVASNKLYGTEPNSDYSKMLESWYAGCPGDGCHVPNYTRDLNAMHEAELNLGEKDCAYTRQLATLVESEWLPMTGFAAYRLTTATAAQRAEALLRTLNLWTE